jgi:pSer/pThr/pTyr-binding forkhead associated (FHA) protein
MVKEGSWTVADLSSANGTSVNDRPAESFVRVRVGDRLRFGDVECEVLDADGGGTGTRATPRKPWWKFW